MNVMDVVSKVQVFNSLMACGSVWDETVPESGGFSPDAAVPPARRQQTEQFVAGVVGVFCNPEGFLPKPLGVKVLHGWPLRPGDVLCSFHHPL